MKAIVLSGGGAKGAYQVGVWKALRKLGIKYDIVTGTSIGAVNGLMMVQRDYFKTVWLWKNISFDVIYDEKFPNKYDTLLEMTEIYKNYAKYFLKNGGISLGKMQNFITKAYNKRKFFSSPIDYGIVTYNLTQMKPVCLRKKDMKNDALDYVLASACCYPAFQKKDINGEKYIDGGYYDNMPINMAIDLGANEIIAVDLDAIGLKKKIKDENVKITYIRPRNSIGSFLVFDKKLASKAIKYGYNDTLKTFGKLDGDKYTFKKGDLEKNYLKYSSKFLDYCNQLLSKNENIYTELLKVSIFNRILKTRKPYEVKKIFNETVEFLGKAFKIDSYYIYDIKKFNKLILERNYREEQMSKKLIEQKLKDKKIKDLFDTSSIVKYIYNLLDDESNIKEILTLGTIFSKEFIGAIYLRVIK